AAGVPNGAMGYQVAVDPRNPGIVYVATSQGLYRSTDAGRSFANVRLPTKNDEVDCTGAVGYGRCEFANFVTDVVVQQPGGTTNASGGGVLAAVGYRASEKQFSNGEVEAPGNGLYYSGTGAPGTFQRLEAPGFAPQERIGRTELGKALGPSQNHDFVYAIVQDARMFNESQLATIDAPDAGLPAVHNTVFNGIYVSSDF